MRLNARLLFGICSILVIVGVLFGVSIYNLNLSNSNVEKAQQERFQKSELSNTMYDEVNNIARFYRDLVLLDLNEHDFSEMVASIRVSRRKMESALKYRETLALRDRTKNVLLQLKTVNHDYIDLQEEIITLASSGKKAEAIQVIADVEESTDSFTNFDQERGR